MKIIYLIGILIILQLAVLNSLSDIIEYILTEYFKGKNISQEIYLESSLFATVLIKNIIPLLVSIILLWYGILILLKQKVLFHVKLDNKLFVASNYKVIGLTFIAISILFIITIAYRLYSTAVLLWY